MLLIICGVLHYSGGGTYLGASFTVFDVYEAGGITGSISITGCG